MNYFILLNKILIRETSDIILYPIVIHTNTNIH